MPQPIKEFSIGRLPVEVHTDNASLGKAAAVCASVVLRCVLEVEMTANAIFATGNSQLSFYQALVQEPGIDWQRVNIFHLDEYVGMSANHPASFRRYLREKLVNLVHPMAFYGVEGDAPDAQAECQRYAALLHAHPAHLCCLGIGENGHMAFNDPPFADFQDHLMVKIVTLDEKSRQQQVGEGYFADLAAVPVHAITLTIPALLAARQVLAIVPEERKAPAVKAALTGPLTSACPASILRQAFHARLYLDLQSASLLDV